jgi:probable non-F420 flavinoid oxidoreductase
MALFSYHASHEQFPPSELLGLVQQAEAAGFDAAFSSDHLQPWSPRQGHSGNAWVWLGAAMQATSSLEFNAITVPCGWRYHPVVLAQAVATLGRMFPGRLTWIAVGSGEALNERVTGGEWPEKEERNQRLREGAEIMKSLLQGETVTRRGRISALRARVWSRPEDPVRIVGAALTTATARWLGGWADGLLTTGTDIDALEKVVAAFRDGGGKGKPIHLKTPVSWAISEATALAQAHEQWHCAVLGGNANCDLAAPEDFELAARFVRPEDMKASVFVSSNLDRHVERLQAQVALGFASINIHNIGRNQAEFIEAFGREVLPRVRSG